jgi:CheY-like chemotaxis protein
LPARGSDPTLSQARLATGPRYVTSHRRVVTPSEQQIGGLFRSRREVGPAGSQPGAHAAPTSAVASGGRAIILVVERDPHIRDLELYFLNEAGYAVEFAVDGRAALEMARALTPRIIITEILVPKLDGLALCRAIKDDPALRGTAVLVFSILAAEGRAREAGADAFLMKPLADRRLVDTVRALIATPAPASTPAAVSSVGGPRP